MKIVHICLYGPVTDGWNYQENIIPKYQINDGHDVWMIASKWCFNTEGKLTYYNKNNYVFNGIHMIRLNLKVGKNINSKFKMYKGLFNELTKIKPDCIFIHNISFFDILEIRRYAKKYNTMIYADNHCDFSNSGRNWLSKNILHKIIWKFCAKRIEPYVTTFYGVLPARVDFLKNIYNIPSCKCKLLMMGADDNLIKDAIDKNSRVLIRKKYNIHGDDLLLMTGGKIDIFKTQTLSLMKFVARLNEKNVKLIVFGSVEEQLKETFMSYVDNERVIYVGWIKPNESYDYFSACDLAVFPGRHSVFWEQVAGMGIPMICKRWEGTMHVDRGGNVMFFEDEELEIVITRLINDKKQLEVMKNIALENRLHFSYKNISRICIGQGDYYD